MKRILFSFARNTVFANILIVLMLLAGVLASRSMIREFFPEFSLDMVSVVVIYPGADPEEVEEGISRKIEESVESVEGIKQYTTYSREGRSTTIIEIKENYDVDSVLDQIRSEIDSIPTFPADAEKPVITEMTVKDSILVLALSADMSERRLKEWAQNVKDEIQQLPEVSQVSLFGVRDYEIAVEVSEKRLREYGLSFPRVVDAIRRSNLNLAGGVIRTEGEEIRVRTVGRKYTGKELSDIVVIARPGGEIVTLGRLARIKDGFTEDPIQAVVNNEPSVLLNVFKTKEEDAIAITSAVNDYIENKNRELPPGAEMKIVYETTSMLRARIDLLVKNGIIGMCLVFLLLWLFLDWRLSFWSGMGIPISLAGGLAILWGIGGTINMISLFGLIMILGIVVDDAIVVGESIFHHRRLGKPPLKAAVDGVCEVGMPVIAAVITTIVAFLPLAFISGIMGKFISILPAVVIACLFISLVECLFLLPAHLNDLPEKTEEKSKNPVVRRINAFHDLFGNGLTWFVHRIYSPFLRKNLKWRYVSLCSAVAILMATFGLVKGGIVKFHVFDKVDGFVILANVEFPNGTPPETTRKAMEQIDSALMRLSRRMKTKSGEPLVEDRLSIIGQSVGEIPQSGPHLGGMYAVLLDSEKRGIHQTEVMVEWEKEVGPIPGVKSLTFEGMAAGPPGAPIEIWIQGQDLDEILAASEELMAKLKKFDGVYQIRSDFSPGKNEIRLELKPEARTLGLTVSDLATQVYAGYYGEEAVRLQRGKDDLRIKVRYTAEERSRISDLSNMRIRTPGGRQLPLLSVADIRFTPGYSAIIRTDGMRRVSVSADVDTGKANTNEILNALSADFFKQLRKDYPGIYVSVQGEKKKMRESFSSLKIGFPIALIGIYIIIATIFRSYAQPFIILITVPFGIIGATLGHLLFGYNLSLMSIFGMVALTGVVVNDAIVLIERVNENLAEKMPLFEAIQSAGRRRFRAIFLTTLSTVGGLAPLILETDFQARFLIPMALAIAAGVIFATVLTLVLIPSLLAILNDIRRFVFWLRHGWFPLPEAVEPASQRKTDRFEDIIEPEPGAKGNLPVYSNDYHKNQSFRAEGENR